MIGFCKNGVWKTMGWSRLCFDPSALPLELTASYEFCMYELMEIIWDEPKRQANRLKHGLDFADLDSDFFADAIFRPAHSGRRQALGWLDGIMVVSVIFRPLGVEAVSVISMRPASANEREIHDEGV